MKGILKVLRLGLLTIGALVFFPSGVHAQQSAITDGIAWLEANQDASGLWGTDKETPFRDATAAVEILCKLDGDSLVISNGLSAIAHTRISSNDYLARKIIAIASRRESVVFPTYVGDLPSTQNDNGGWGYNKGYGSNVLETALALRALKSASYSNMTKLGQGVSYLTSHQDADSGWAFVADDSSQVFYTAHVIITLAMLEGDFSVFTQIQGGVNWLKTQAHGDGGFGTGGISNPYETGLALAAMIRGDPSASEITDAWSYLETTQLPNGSWNDDAYSTAMAIYGLMHIAPDLAVGTSDIVLSNPMPSDSEIVIISATIHNTGVLDADSVLVQVFDGHPDVGGTQIGSDVTIFSLASGGDSTIQVDWNTYGLAGDHDIYVLVDPLNEIREPEKLNNTAKKSVHVYFPPDLIIYHLGFDPPDPDTSDTVIIQTTVKNVGELTATDVSLQLWHGDPDAGGIPLMGSPYIISSIAPGLPFTLNLNCGNYFNTDDCYDIYACADRENTIREISEFNNCRCETLCVGPVCLAVASNTGLNLLGLPLQPIDPLSSFTIIPQIPHCNEIDGWDRVSQMWISAVVDTGTGFIIGDDFDIELQDGFFARVTEASDTLFCGMRVKEHGCTYSETGLNMISVPNEDACYTAYTLIDDINACVEAHMWDAALQVWVSAVKISEDSIVGEDFPVTPENGYFIKVEVAGEWCTRDCDTITNLPDLLVTPDDIWLDPNPVVSGDTVGIWVNMHNIGTDTAYSPWLSLSLNDPDEGGSIFAEGELPLDIPPGGSSGYWGARVVFEGSGFPDIYGIADYYDYIEELNETNNKAYQTLEVLPPPLSGTPPPAGDEQSSVKLVGLLNGRSSGSLKLNPELIPVPVQISSLPFVSKEVPITKGLAKTSTSPATKIYDAIIGNHSSSSVTITWITDGLADGCINYGATPALGLTKCEDGPGSEIHLVVLDNLTANTSYYFEIVSGGITDDNEGEYYSFTTTMSGVGVPAIIYGHVNNAGNNSPAGNVIVSGTLSRGGINSYPLTGLTNPNGIWVLNLGNLKSPISNNVLAYEIGDTVFLQLQGGSDGVGADTIVISGDSPQGCGTQEIGISTQVDEPTGPTSGLLPDHCYLSVNYPNPFNLSTIMKFGLPCAGHVELSIYNIVGQKVITLLNQDYQAGNHAVTWNGQNANGQPVSSGIYFYRLKSGEFIQIRKMLLLK